MNKHERATAIRAMEFLARSLNDESIFNLWLSLGVADGDIDGSETDDDLEYYYEDDTDFAEIMDVFLTAMARAKKSGGLYIDGVVSKDA